MAQPTTQSRKGAVPDDDLDKQVDDMLDALEDGVDALFDKVGGSSQDDSFGDLIADAIHEAEAAAAPPSQSLDPSEPGSDEAPIACHAPEVSDEAPSPESAMATEAEAMEAAVLDASLDDAIDEGERAIEDDAHEPEPIEAVDDGGAPDRSSAPDMPQAELDQAIAEAVAEAEESVDEGAFDPPTRELMPIGADDADEQGEHAIGGDVARELRTQSDDEDPSAPEAVPVDISDADPEPEPEPVSEAETDAEQPASASTTAETVAPSPEAQIKVRPWARFAPIGKAAWAHTKPVSVKVGGTAARTMSRPLVMLDPAMRDYVGYAAAVTAFMGVCVWVFSLI